MNSTSSFEYMLGEDLVETYMEPAAKDPLEAMENPEKIERRRTRNANMRHKARDIRHMQDLGGDGFSGARRLKTSKAGKPYVCEGRTPRMKSAGKKRDARARRRESMELDIA